MKNIYIILSLLIVTSEIIAQTRGLPNLDAKYGFNKFTLEEPYSKYENSCRFEYADNDGVKKYFYSGPDVGKVFGYFVLDKLNLFFYKDKLAKIELEFGYLTKENENYIYMELVKLYGSPQKFMGENFGSEFFYAWLSDKTSLYYGKLINQLNTAQRTVVIQVISGKVYLEVANDRF